LDKCKHYRSSKIESVIVDGEELSSEISIATAFNNFFSTVAGTIESTLPPADNISPCSLISRQRNSFYLFDVNTEEVIRIISNLKNTSYGPNGISVKLFKIIKHIVAPYLVLLVNESFQTVTRLARLKVFLTIGLFLCCPF